MGLFVVAATIHAFLYLFVASYPYEDQPCKWRSHTGSHFDLQKLTITDQNRESYVLQDGDIPCTPETEPTYSYVFNFCADVTSASYPKMCDNGNIHKTGAAIQYLNRTDGYTECEVIGHYDSTRDDTYYSLIDERDPSKGVAIKYTYGDKCPFGVLRTATIEVECSNSIDVTEISATEPSKCDYHIVVKSMYGCPTQCPLTSKGLCNSHGHCAYDSITRRPHCFCNSGYGGEACDSPSSSSDSSSSNSGSSSSTVETSTAFKVELGFLIVLVVVMVILVAFVVYLVLKVAEFRKMQSTLPPLSSSGFELIGSELAEHQF